MNMQNVKEIQIPDSRYRQLDYIHFSGAEALNCWYQFLSGTTYKRIDMRCRYLVNNNWGSSGFYSSSNNKMLLGVNGSGKTQFAVGSRYVYNTSDLISIDTTNFYTWALWSNNGNCDLSIYRDAEETDLVGKTNTYSYTFDANSGRFYVGAYNNNGTLTGYATMDIAYVILRVNSYSNIVFNGIPCQRKSDGVCGLYDSISGLFWPMEGTEITTNAAGPTVDENMPIYVKKIESNNQIIWGSQSAFPYRRLEYIHFSGAEYVDTGLKANYPKNRAIWIKTDSDMTTTSARVIGAYSSGSADNARRCYFVANRDGGFGFALGNQWVGGKATSYKNDKVLMYGTINSTGKTTSWGVKSPDDVTTYDSGSITTGGAVGQTANIAIGTNLNDAGNPDASVYYKGNVYLYRIKNTNGSGPIENDMYPAQRKSDGVCGLYDVKTNTFQPMIGTTITDAAAGPVVDEYWDLTA